MSPTAEEIQTEISALLRLLASPGEPGESVQSCIRRAARRSGLTFNQAKRGWYREWKHIPAHIADDIREKAAGHDRKLKAEALQTLLSMQDSDPDFYRDAVEALRHLLRGEREARRHRG